MKLNIAEQIQTYRKELGLTQEQLAEQLGVTNQAVSKWETEQSYPDIQLLPQLAELFHVTLDQLFGCGTAAPAAPVQEGLPWEDDGDLRAVVFVGRKLCDSRRLDSQKDKVELSFRGAVRDIHSDFSVVVENSRIEGSVIAGDGVRCGDVGGSVTAGDEVNCGNVFGSVTAGDGVSCGSVGGNVNAGDSVSCGNIGGAAFGVEILRRKE